jgi:hypothetical protein
LKEEKFNMITQFVIDGMHAVYQNAVKRWIDCYRGKKSKDQTTRPTPALTDEMLDRRAAAAEVRAGVIERRAQRVARKAAKAAAIAERTARRLRQAHVPVPVPIPVPVSDTNATDTDDTGPGTEPEPEPEEIEETNYVDVTRAKCSEKDFMTIGKKWAQQEFPFEFTRKPRNFYSWEYYTVSP